MVRPDRAVSLPETLRAELLVTLASALEFQLDEPGTRAGLASNIVAEVSSLELGATARAQIKRCRKQLLALLKEVPFEDLDAELVLGKLLEWTGLSFHEDRRVLDPILRDRLREELAAVIENESPPSSRVLGDLTESLLQATHSRLPFIETQRESGLGVELHQRVLEYQYHEKSPDRASLLRDIMQIIHSFSAVIWKAPPQAKPYPARYELEDRVLHPRFGEGVVMKLFEGKIEVRFADGTRILKQG